MLALPDEQIISAIKQLLIEAIADRSASKDFEHVVSNPSFEWGFEGDTEIAKQWLTGIIQTPDCLVPYTTPAYWAQREGLLTDKHESSSSLAKSFALLLLEMQHEGYFPMALPRDCVDDSVDWGSVSKNASKALLLDFAWDGSVHSALQWNEPLLYSLMEYFHDEAQRPRVEDFIHTYGGCGPHYGLHNSESGRVVYRWRVNGLLEKYRSNFHLGSTGEEQGRLIRVFSSDFEERADERVRAAEANPEDQVSLAIRQFRAREASVAQKRHALTLLANVLEQRRNAMKIELGNDESDLFNIANNFGFRHFRSGQKEEFGEDFLDYLFTVFFAATLLMESLEQRELGLAESN